MSTQLRYDFDDEDSIYNDWNLVQNRLQQMNIKEVEVSDKRWR